jgi:hypothetical protein
MEDTWYWCRKCLVKYFFPKLMRCEFWFEEVSSLVYVMNENGHVVNTIEREHRNAPVLKLPVEIIWYVACTDTSR